MIQGTCTCFFRKDVIKRFGNLPFEDVNINHIVINLKKTPLFTKDHIIMFVDDDGRQKIVKNRYGRGGEITAFFDRKYIQGAKLLKEFIELFKMEEG